MTEKGLCHIKESERLGQVRHRAPGGNICGALSLLGSCRSPSYLIRCQENQVHGTRCTSHSPQSSASQSARHSLCRWESVSPGVPRSQRGSPPGMKTESGSTGPRPMLGSLPPLGDRSSQGGGAQWLPDWRLLLRNVWKALQIGQTPLLRDQPLPADSDPVGLEGDEGSTFLRAPQ